MGSTEFQLIMEHLERIEKRLDGLALSGKPESAKKFLDEVQAIELARLGPEAAREFYRQKQKNRKTARRKP
jgi:hypothetical protein